MRYIVILTENTRGSHPSDVSVRAIQPFRTLREAKVSVKGWKAYEESHQKSSWTVKRATIWNMEGNFLIDEITIY